MPSVSQFLFKYTASNFERIPLKKKKKAIPAYIPTLGPVAGHH